MTKWILLAAAGVAIGGGILYFSRANHWPSTSRVTQGVMAVPPELKTVCVERIQNLSGKPVSMDGVDDELVAQLQKVGFASSRTVSDNTGPRCDATVNAELVELSGRARKTALIDFRFTLRGEEPPRISATVVGKSADGRIAKFATSFRAAEAAPQSDENRAEHEALMAAVGSQANQIRAAYLLGLPPWFSNSGKGQ